MTDIDLTAAIEEVWDLAWRGLCDARNGVNDMELSATADQLAKAVVEGSLPHIREALARQIEADIAETHNYYPTAVSAMKYAASIVRGGTS